jgi:hypothetical protein
VTTPLEGLEDSQLFPVSIDMEGLGMGAETLACPHCGGTLVHTDTLWIVKNDMTWKIDLSDGKNPVVKPIKAGDKPPINLDDDTGRRYVIALQAWCEECVVDTSWVFTQHKGTTKMYRRASGTWEAA